MMRGQNMFVKSFMGSGRPMRSHLRRGEKWQGPPEVKRGRLALVLLPNPNAVDGAIEHV